MIIDANKNIKMTRGDSADITIELTTSGGEAYDFSNDVVKFGVKRSAFESNLAIEKTVDSSTGKFTLEPEDTANLEFGDYLYDIRVYHTDSETGTVSISTPISAQFSLGYNVLPSVAPEVEDDNSDDNSDESSDDNSENDSENNSNEE